MKATSPISELSRYKIKKIGKLVFEFCSKNLGKSKNKQWPKLTLSYMKQNEYMGLYSPRRHQIYIFVDKCKTLSDLTSTIIHEWTHSKQRILTDYGRLDKKWGYDKNPLEIEAYESEKIWNKKVLAYVKSNL